VGKHEEAEPLLVQGYEGLKQREKDLPPEARDRVMAEALDRLAALHAASGRRDEADRYRAERRRYPELLPPPAEER
jgi:hypothetical protein